MSHTQKVAISLPKELAQKLEKTRKHLGFNRSQFYRLALKAYIEEFPDEEKNKQIAKLYQQIQETDKELLRHFKKHSYKHLPPYKKKEIK